MFAKAGASEDAKTGTQSKIVLKRKKPESVDEALARFFFGNNISTRVVETTTFKELVQAICVAPVDWMPPNRHRLGGPCLENLCRTLREEEAPLRKALLRYGGTVLSDGWDSVDRNLLVNHLVATSAGIFFCGTVELRSSDHEDTNFVAQTFNSIIDTTGPLAIVQICSDTCNVMKSAWRRV